jgi:hypothetical protein
MYLILYYRNLVHTHIKHLQPHSSELHFRMSLYVVPPNITNSSNYCMVVERCVSQCSEILGLVTTLPFSRLNIKIMRGPNDELYELTDQVSA